MKPILAIAAGEGSANAGHYRHADLVIKTGDNSILKRTNRRGDGAIVGMTAASVVFWKLLVKVSKVKQEICVRAKDMEAV